MKNSIKVCYVLSGVDKGISFEWLANGLNKEVFNLSFIFLDCKSSSLERKLKESGFETYITDSNSFLKKLTFVFSTLRIIKPDIIHTHYRTANNTGILAAKLVGIKNRIHTRHNGTYNHLYHPKSVWVDKLLNRVSTHIIAISSVIEEILIERENVPKRKINLINHGFDLKWLSRQSSSKVKSMKTKYEIDVRKHPVIGVISRYVEWKGHFFIIEAFKEVLKQFPNALLILVNASGPDEQSIKRKLVSDLPKTNYLEIPFEEDIPTLYSTFDVFVHVPIDRELEAFGQIYIESLATGVPSVFTLSGVAPEFIRDSQNALVVPFKESREISKAILRILTDKTLSNKLITNGYESVKQFELKKYLSRMEDFYMNVMK